MGAYEPLSDIALMLRVRHGEEAAFRALHDRYQRRLLNFFYGMSRDSQAACDMCQESFLRIWKVRKRYRATGTFSAYLFGIARMVWRERCREYYRHGLAFQSHGAGSPPEAVAAVFTPCQYATCNEMANHVLDALQKLPEEQRMVFVMRTIEGLSLEDIAVALDCPVNTVRSRKVLGIKKLRHLLETVFHHPEDRRVRETQLP